MAPRVLGSSYESEYPYLRDALAPPLRRLPSDRLDEIFGAADLAPEELEEFLSGIGRAFASAGRAVGQALPQIAQIAAPIAQAALPIVGGAIGGPVGAAVGGLAGQALSGLAKAPAARAGAAGSAPQPAAAAAPRPPAAAGSPAAAQLLQLLGDPRLLQALVSTALGAAGSRSVPVGGGARVAPAALTSLVGLLANQASAEALALEGSGGAAAASADYAENLADPANSEARAAALLDLLHETYDEVAPRRRSAPLRSHTMWPAADTTGEDARAFGTYYDAYFGVFETEESDDAADDWPGADGRP